MRTSAVTLFIFTFQYLLYVYVHVYFILDILRLNLLIYALLLLVIRCISCPVAFYLLALDALHILYGNVIAIYTLYLHYIYIHSCGLL